MINHGLAQIGHTQGGVVVDAALGMFRRDSQAAQQSQQFQSLAQSIRSRLTGLFGLKICELFLRYQGRRLRPWNAIGRRPKKPRPK